MKSNDIKFTKLNIDADSQSTDVLSLYGLPLSENEKSLDTLVQQHINTQIKAAETKGLPYTVTDKESGTISIVQDGKIIRQKKLRSVV